MFEQIGQLLDSIGPGDFERLASAYLRKRDPRFAMAINHGVNADGKAINDPIDATTVAVVGGVRWHAIAYHTTVKPRKLREKWLGTKTVDGDITCGIAEARRIRALDPNANVVVALTTNTLPRSDFTAELHTLAGAAGIELIIIEQSQLQSYLAHDPDGQWHRREFGLPQDRLSRHLLADLCERGFAAYGAEIFYDQERVVDRALDRRIDAALASATPGVVFLVSEAGYGKSVACARVMQKRIAAGATALRVLPADLDGAPDIEAVLRKMLRRFEPALDANCGADCLKIASLGGAPLVIVVDDVEKSADPQKVVEHVGMLAERSGGGRPGSIAPRLLCPMWPKTFELVRRESSDRAAIVRAGPFETDEAAAAVAASLRLEGVERTRAYELASICRNDPLLIALLPGDAAGRKLSQLYGDTIITDYIERRCEAIARRCGALREDVCDALAAVGRAVVQHSELSPSIETLRRDIETGPLLQRLLPGIILDQTVVAAVDDGAGRRLHFRHERVRDALIKRAFVRAYSAGDDTDQFMDPYYSEAVGRGLAELPALPDDLVQRVSRDVPAALAYGVQTESQRGDPSPALVKALRARILTLQHDVSSQVQSEYNRVLSRTDSPIVLDLTAGVEDSYGYARLRHGDAAQALTVGRLLATAVFFDSAAVVEEALTANHEGVVAAVRAGLRGETDDDLVGALGIAIHLSKTISADELVLPLEHPLIMSRVVPYVWVALLAHPAPTATSLRRAFDALLDLPADDAQSELHLAAVEVSRFADRATPQAVSFLAREMPPHRQEILQYMLYSADSPAAVDYWIGIMATRTDSLDLALDVDRLIHNYRASWRARGSTSRSHLLGIWRQQTAGESVRRCAMQLWARTATERDLAALRAIPHDDELYDDALRVRLTLGDADASGALMERLRSSAWVDWMQYAANVPNEATLAEVRATFGRYVSDLRTRTADLPVLSALVHLLRSLPPEESEELILANREALVDPAFVAVAFEIGTTAIVEWADRELLRVRHDSDGTTLTALVVRVLDSSDIAPMTNSRFRAIEALLPALPPAQLVYVATSANRRGLEEWRRRCVDPRLPHADRRAYEETDVWLDEQLDPIAATPFGQPVNGRLRAFVAGFEFRGRSTRDALARVLAWQARKHSIDSYAVAAEAVQQYGIRADADEISARCDPIWGTYGEIVRDACTYAVRRRTIA